jgi:hypothetical protein
MCSSGPGQQRLDAAPPHMPFGIGDVFLLGLLMMRLTEIRQRQPRSRSRLGSTSALFTVKLLCVFANLHHSQGHHEKDLKSHHRPFFKPASSRGTAHPYAPFIQPPRISQSARGLPHSNHGCVNKLFSPSPAKAASSGPPPAHTAQHDADSLTCSSKTESPENGSRGLLS